MSLAEWYRDWDNLWNDVDDQTEPAPPPLPRHPRIKRLARITGVVLGLALVLAVGAGASFWMAASGLLAAVDQQDTRYLVRHVDWPVLRQRLDVQLGELDQLRQMAAQPSGGTIESVSFLTGVSQHISGRLAQPAGLVDMLHTRLFFSGPERDQAQMSLYAHVQSVAMTEAGVVLRLASEDGGTSGVNLCFAVRGLMPPAWQLTGIGFPELGGQCGR